MKTFCSRISDSETYDGAVSRVVQLDSDELILFYHQSDIGHVAPDGRVVMRRSTDGGETWTDEAVIHDEPNRDVLDPSVVYIPETNRLVLFDVPTGFAESVESKEDLETLPERENFSTCLLESTDGGRTWSEPTEITHRLTGRRVVPFGGGVRTSQGFATFFYSGDWQLQALISDDGGESWGKHVHVSDSPEGRQLCEPVPCALSRSKMLLFGRENNTGDFYALRSDDGGLTWDDPTFFNPTNSPSPKPIWVERTGRNRLTAVWGDRDDLYIYSVTASAQLAWQDPAEISGEDPKRIHRHIGSSETASYWDGDAGDFGYPTFAKPEPRREDIMVFFYDGAPYPDIWKAYLY